MFIVAQWLSLVCFFLVDSGVILSAQATDKGVNKATAKLYPVANTPATIYALGIQGLNEYIKTIGLYNSKGKNIIHRQRAFPESLACRIRRTEMMRGHCRIQINPERKKGEPGTKLHERQPPH